MGKRAASYGDVSVVIPTVNESSTVGTVVSTIKRLYDSAEVIVVDGESSDGTAEAAKSAGADKVLSQSPKGYGGAIRFGAASTNRSIVVMVDGDGTYDLSIIPEMVKLAREGQVSVGGRFHSKPHAMPVGRFVGNMALSLLLRILTGIRVTDSQSGLKAFPRGLISHMSEDGMTFSTEVLVRGRELGLKINEIPMPNYFPRAAGSKSKLKAAKDGLPISLFIVAERIRSKALLR